MSPFLLLPQLFVGLYPRLYYNIFNQKISPIVKVQDLNILDNSRFLIAAVFCLCLTLGILYNIISSDLAEESFHQVAGSVLTHSSLLELPLKSVVQEEYKSLMFLRMGLKDLAWAV